MADIGPEVQSLFGQDMLQTMQMLLETVTNELDGAADSLVRDNQALRALLTRGADAVRILDGGLAEEIAVALDEPADPSLTNYDARHPQPTSQRSPRAAAGSLRGRRGDNDGKQGVDGRAGGRVPASAGGRSARLVVLGCV